MEYHSNGVATEGSFGESVNENSYTGSYKAKSGPLTHSDFQKLADSFITPKIEVMKTF